MSRSLSVLAASAVVRARIQQLELEAALLPRSIRETEREFDRTKAQRDVIAKLTLGLVKPFRKRLTELEQRLEDFREREFEPQGELSAHNCNLEMPAAWAPFENAFWALVNTAQHWYIAQEERAMSKLLDLKSLHLRGAHPAAFSLDPNGLVFRTESFSLYAWLGGWLLEQQGKPLVYFGHEDVKLTETEEPFRVKRDEVPEDAQVIFETWEFVTSDGKPDPNLPESANPAIAVVRYGRLIVTVEGGPRFDFLFSSRAKTLDFAATWLELVSPA
jgi:hypothetical protein